ncbi:MAG: YraN family protein [Proteobacteria bacterium]|nr:YraN family protein [Pseudomonadota bacterium]
MSQRDTRAPSQAHSGSRKPARSTSRIVDAQPTPAQARGQLAEELAARHLVRQGLRVIERNVRCRGGEVDLICVDRDLLVFVEVRLRTSSHFGGAAESITAAKRQRILLAAQWWLCGAGRRYRAAPCRFDAVLLDGLDEQCINWLPGAFDAG